MDDWLWEGRRAHPVSRPQAGEVPRCTVRVALWLVRTVMSLSGVGLVANQCGVMLPTLAFGESNTQSK